MTDPESNLKKFVMVGPELIKKSLILCMLQFGFSLFTEIFMSTESMTKARNSIFWVGLNNDLSECIKDPVYKANPKYLTILISINIPIS